MRLSISTDSLILKDNEKECFESLIQRAARIGFSAVDLSFTKALSGWHEIMENDYLARAKRLRVYAESLNVSLYQAHAPFYDILDPQISDKSRDFYESMVIRSIRYCGEAGVKWLVFHPGTDYQEAFDCISMAKNYDYFMDKIKYMRKYQVGVALENMIEHCNLYEKRTKRRYCVTAEELMGLVQILQNEYQNVGVCWDTGHANQSSLNQERSIAYLSNDLIALHANDNHGVADEHMMPYLGEIQWKGIMESLYKNGYVGTFNLEIHKYIHGFPPELREQALSFAYQISKELIIKTGGMIDE